MPLTKKQKILIGTVAVVLLIILIVVVCVLVVKSKKPKAPKGAASAAAKAAPKGGKDVKTKKKAVEELCAPTMYKESCEKSLENVDTSDPKELMKAVFNAAEKSIGDALKNSSLIQAAATDVLTKGAFEVCKQVLQNSVDDLKRSMERIDKFDESMVEVYIFDLKTWLSGAITNQQTCIDAFEDTTGDTGEKMKQLLKTAAELSSNSLAMVDEFKKGWSAMMGESTSSEDSSTEGHRRRLLSDNEDEETVRMLYETPQDYQRSEEPPSGAGKARVLEEPPQDYVRDPEPPGGAKKERLLYTMDYQRSEEPPSGAGKATVLEEPPQDYVRDPEPPGGAKKERLLYTMDYQRIEEPPSGAGRLLYQNAMDYQRIEEPPSGAGKLDVPNWVSKTARRLMAAVPGSVKPDVVVAKDGSGQFKTISDAFKSMPPTNNKTYVIFVKAGVYNENVVVPPKFVHVVLMGEGPTKTKIVGNKNVAEGVPSFFTATLIIDAENFMVKDIGIENTAGASKKQALAVRASGDKAVFHNVRMEGYQDTLCAHLYRQFYRDCYISGTIDFVFGDALVVLQNCRFVVRKPDVGQECAVTAQGRLDPKSISATIIINGDIVADPAFLQTKPKPRAFLGRPWKTYSRVVIMNSNIEGFLEPEGWSPWKGNFALDTLYYGEFGNRGAGSNLSMRPKWKGMQKFSPQVANSWTAGRVFGKDQAWITENEVPYYPGLKA